MDKSLLIGKGMTAEVYKWEQDKVLKLFFEKYDDERVQYEAEIGKAVHEAAAPSPGVFGVVGADGRKGIIFERIYGKTMLVKIREEPWLLYYYIKRLAALQYHIHQCTSESLPSQTQRLSSNIERASSRLGDRKGRVLEYLYSLPDGTSICHGDIHFNNVIVSGKKLTAVDWNGAYRGNPLGDVARTFLMMNSPVAISGIPPVLTGVLQGFKRRLGWFYLAEYMRLSKASRTEIEKWLLPIAAAKLKDNDAGDEKRLLKIIDKHLSHLDQ